MNSFVLFGVLLRFIIHLIYTLRTAWERLYLDIIVYTLGSTLGKRSLEDEPYNSDKGPLKKAKQDIPENSEQDSELPESSHSEPESSCSEPESSHSESESSCSEPESSCSEPESSAYEADDELSDGSGSESTDYPEIATPYPTDLNRVPLVDYASPPPLRGESGEVPQELPSKTPSLTEAGTTAPDPDIPDGIGIPSDDNDWDLFGGYI